MCLIQALTLLLLITHNIRADGVETENAAIRLKHKVLLVSMDGFRYDYLDKTDTPNFDRMAKVGVKVPYVNNSFITNTFPSHYTIATGLYSESHGIIGSHMYDPVFNSTFNKPTVEERWFGGEPIWTTVEKAGLKAGVYFWIGSETINQGIRPTFWLPYKENTLFEIRVKTVVSWLKNNGIDLGVLYFHEPDRTGHDHGPESPEILLAIRRMDGVLGFILDQLEAAGLTDTTNVIITSDHGMASVDLSKHTIDLNQYINSSLLLRISEQGTTANMFAQPGKATALRDALKDVKHMNVFLKEDIPERFHLKNNRRVGDVFAIADLGWTITDDYEERVAWGYKGDHGYDNELDIMKPILLATGPDFKVNQVVDPVRNVDLYPLICHLLNITQAPNNGSLERAKTLLSSSGNSGKRVTVSTLAVWMLVVFALVQTCF